MHLEYHTADGDPSGGEYGHHPTAHRNAELPVVRVGRCVRLREDDVDALIRRGYTGRSPNKQHLAAR